MNKSSILWPCDLSDSVKNALFDAAQIIHLEPDGYLLIGRDANNGLCCITKGLVVLHILDMRKPTPSLVFKTGDWFGGSLIDDTSFRFQVKVSCIDHAEIVCIPEPVIKAMAAKHPEIYKLLFMVTRARANENTEMLFAATGLTLQQKVAFFLLSISKKFPHVPGAKPRISISQNMLAQALGLSRSKLNKQLQLLEHEGIISVERMNIHILDIPLLETMIARQ